MTLIAFAFSCARHGAIATDPAKGSSFTTPGTAELVLEQYPFRLYSAFSYNLHNVLWAAAWAGRPATSKRSPAGSLPEPLTGNLTSEDRTAWEAAVSYYDRELADRDPFFGMADIRKALIAVAGELPKSGLAPEHRQVLAAAAPVYRRYWWPLHDRANRAWIAETMPKVASLTPEVPDRLVNLFGTSWFTSSLRVDVVRVTSRQGAFTSKDPAPAHITISSGNLADWNSVETVFHESSHALFGQMMDAFVTESRAQRKNTRDLWHVTLFYITGEVVREALASRGIDYEPYLYKKGFFDQAWPHFKAPVETYMKAYLKGEMSRTEAIKRLVSEVDTEVDAGSATGSRLPSK